MAAELREEQGVVSVRDGDFQDGEGSRSEGERSEPEQRGPSKETAGSAGLEEAERPDPEVPAKAQRRKFSAGYKRRILEEADACTGDFGAMGALLRREGLYFSNLSTWRRQRERGQLDALAPKKRGRKGKPVNPLAGKVRALESENRRLQEQLEKAETIIGFQKKLSEMLGIPLDRIENDEGC